MNAFGIEFEIELLIYVYAFLCVLKKRRERVWKKHDANSSHCVEIYNKRNKKLHHNDS